MRDHAASSFLSHLSGDEEDIPTYGVSAFFLSHLSGDEEHHAVTAFAASFLSHLSGDEEELYPKKVNYTKGWRAKTLILPSIFCLGVTV